MQTKSGNSNFVCRITFDRHKIRVGSTIVNRIRLFTHVFRLKKTPKQKGIASGSKFVRVLGIPDLLPTHKGGIMSRRAPFPTPVDSDLKRQIKFTADRHSRACFSVPGPNSIRCRFRPKAECLDSLPGSLFCEWLRLLAQVRIRGFQKPIRRGPA